MKKRIISLLLVMALLGNGFPLYGFATENADDEPEYQIKTAVVPYADVYAVGDTVTVQIKVASNDVSVGLYSAYDIKISFDTDVLAYESAAAADADAEISQNDGSLRIKGYGKDKTLTTVAATIVFQIKAPGEGTISVNAAKVDRSENAGVQNAPEAGLPENDILIKAKQYYTVTFKGNGLMADSRVASPESDYLFRVVDPDLFDYIITAVSGGVDITDQLLYDPEAGSCTIPKEAIIGDIIITSVRTQKPGEPGTTDPTTPTDPKPTEPEDPESTEPDQSQPTDPTQPQPTDPTQPEPTEPGPTYPQPSEPTRPSGPSVPNPPESNSGSSQKTVEASAYLTMDETILYMILYRGKVAQGQIPKYDGNNMYWSEKYNAYVWLMTDTAELDEVETMAKSRIAVSEGSVAGTVNYSGNVDLSLYVDMRDVMLVRDLYNVQYTLENMEMLKFLNADLNGDKKLDILDAAVAVDIVLNGEEEDT